jgi:alpha-mannosidase
MTQSTVHVIAHTHWDREWYMPFELHRARLVELLDTLIELMEREPRFHRFHLDGQTIILDDYLEVRPQMRERLTALTSSGRIQVGPWYILQDAFLTSGEANVRNLLIGHRHARAFGAVCKVGYFPDTFGLMGQAPQLLRQAGIDNAIFGRGVRPVGFNNTTVGAYDSPGSELRWQAPDGSTVLGVLLANWYHNGKEIPSEPQPAARYWTERIAAAERFAHTPHLLFLNGSDHQPVQTDLVAALDAARAQFPALCFVQTDFPSYLAALRDSLPEELPAIRGELRSQHTDGWNTLVHTASARITIKQANWRCQTWLEKAAEPLAAFAALSGSPYPRDLLTYAWKVLLQNHPHDSICGCSVDAVHREMFTRFAKSEQVATAVAQSSLAAISAQIDTTIFQACDPVALPFVVVNSSGWARSGAVKVEVEIGRQPIGPRPPEDRARLEALPADGYHVIDSVGQAVAATIEDLGVRFGYELPADRFRERYFARALRVTLAAQEVPALGYRSYALVRRAPAVAAARAPVLPFGVLENQFLRVEIGEDGTLRITDRRSGRAYAGLGAYEDVGDIGNEYMFRQAEGDQGRTTAGLPAQIALTEHSAVRTVYTIVHTLPIPQSADASLEREQRELVPLPERRAGRSANLLLQTITTEVTLEQAAASVQVEVRLDNQARDHRLRALFPTGCAPATHWADSIFEVVERSTTPGPEWRNPSACQHQQAFVSVCDEAGGLTIANQGLPEYEVLRDWRGTIALTLLRAVGELGDWGDFPTPEAQCPGTHTFRYAIIPNGGAGALGPAHGEAYQFQVPWLARQLPLQAGRLPPEHAFLRWTGEHLALSAVKLAEESDELLVRWFNMSAQPTRLELGPVAGVGSWCRSTILEQRADATDGGGSFAVRPAEILTIGGTLQP